MEAIRVQRTIDSETLYLPELKRFIGKNMEIILLEVPAKEQVEIKRDIRKFIEASTGINIDEKAIEQLREKSMV